MNQTIKINHFISKEALSSISRLRNSVQAMVNSAGFRSIIRTAMRTDTIAYIKYSNFVSNE